MSVARIVVLPGEPIAPIRREVYGHFIEHLGACIEGGIWIGEDSPLRNIAGLRADVVEALRALRIPVLRWPGGCFADDYHWEDGIGPRPERPRRVNLWWGEEIETNAFGTHEFIRLCRELEAEPYLCGNVGSGSPRELREWLEYCNFAGDSTLARRRAANGSPEPFAVRFWGIGNESWGCGGHFQPEEYAAEYRRFATFMRELSGVPLFLVACGPNGNDRDWTACFFEKLGRFRRIHGYAAHYYTSNRDGVAGTATEYDAAQWYTLLGRALEVERLVVEQRALMDAYDPERRIGLVVDEWGTWHPPAPGRKPLHLWQQNTLRDALVAALTLDVFHRHADRVAMANIAQTVNVLQAMVLTEGSRMVLTPTYHVFAMYRSHQGAEAVRCEFQAEAIAFQSAGSEQRLPGLAGSASRRGGEWTLSVVNPSATDPVEATIEWRGPRPDRGTVTVLAHADIRAHNTFEEPAAVVPVRSAVTPGAEWRHVFPPASVTVFRLSPEADAGEARHPQNR